MAKNKASDSAGLVIEIVQKSSETMLQALVDLFNEVLVTSPTSTSMAPRSMEGVRRESIVQEA